MPSIREAEGQRYAAPDCRGQLVKALILTPGPFGDARLDDEMFSSRLTNEATSRTFKAMVLKVLLQMNFDVIRAIALGTLPQEIRGALETYFTNDYVNVGNEVPAIYVNYIVNKDGIPPTQADIIEILVTMRKYLGKGSRNLAKQIDTQFGESKEAWRYASTLGSQQAQVRFIEGMEKRLHLTEGSDDTPGAVASEPASDPDTTGAADTDVDTNTLSQAAESVYSQSDISQDAMDQPIACGISEVGFSITPYKRIRDHQRHSGSNNIMNLFDACARYLFGDRYSIEGYVVARIVDPTLVSLSEVVISRLACSYTDWGGGFNAKLAGLSVQGLNNLPMIQADTKLTREAWITLEANEDMANVEDELVRVQKRTESFKERITARLERHNELTDRLISAQEELIFQKNRLADIRRQTKEVQEKWREFKREADKSYDPNWLENIRKFCSDPLGQGTGGEVAQGQLGAGESDRAGQGEVAQGQLEAGESDMIGQGEVAQGQT